MRQLVSTLRLLYHPRPPCCSPIVAAHVEVETALRRPFGGLIFFFGLSFFTRNQNLSRFVRFNIQQAILLDIILLIPGFFGGAAGNMFPLELQGACVAKLEHTHTHTRAHCTAHSLIPRMTTRAAMGTNFVFYLWVGVVGYSWFSIAQGKTPTGVPVISEAANMQIGPY